MTRVYTVMLCKEKQFTLDLFYREGKMSKQEVYETKEISGFDPNNTYLKENSVEIMGLLSK